MGNSKTVVVAGLLATYAVEIDERLAALGYAQSTRVQVQAERGGAVPSALSETTTHVKAPAASAAAFRAEVSEVLTHWSSPNKIREEGYPRVSNDDSTLPAQILGRDEVATPDIDTPAGTKEIVGEAGRLASIASHRAEFRRRAQELVPEIGEWRRWYDLLYKATASLLRGKPRRFLPRWARRGFELPDDFALRVQHSRQYKVWPEDDLTRRLNIPDEEHASFPCLWVVELFPPSPYEGLLRASRRKGWKQGRAVMQREQNQEILEASHNGRGWSWWNLADIIDPRATYSFGGEIVERLPDEFVSVELRGITVGPSPTAVVGCFTVDKAADKALDDVWPADHEPSVVRRGPTLQVEDGLWSGFRQTQQKRQSIHDAARAWMSESLPGLFATSNEPQLVLGLCLTD